MQIKPLTIQLSVATNTIHTLCRTLEFDKEKASAQEESEIQAFISDIDEWKKKLPKNGPGIAYRNFLNRVVKDLKERLDS